MLLVPVSLLLRSPTSHTGLHSTLYTAPPPSHQPYGRGQNEAAPPPYGRWARVPGGWAEEQTYFLVGNN